MWLYCKEIIQKDTYGMASSLEPYQTVSLERCHEKTCFFICENKDTDELHGNRTAGQHHCFHYIDSTIPLLPELEILSV